MTRGINGLFKISSPICDAIICNNNLHRLLSRSFFEVDTLKLTTLPAKQVDFGFGHFHFSEHEKLQCPQQAKAHIKNASHFRSGRNMMH